MPSNEYISEEMWDEILETFEVIDRDVEPDLSSELRDAEEVVARDLATTEAAATATGVAAEPFGISGVVGHSVATAIAVPTGATVSFGAGGCVLTETDPAWQLPGVTSQLPGVTSQLPGANSQLPGAVAGSARPDFAQQLTGSTSQLPGVTSQLPGATRQQLPGAVAGSIRPDFAQQLTGSTSQLTGANSQLPGATRQQLPGAVAGSTRPDFAQQLPGSTSQLPGANSQLPGVTRQQLPGAVAGSTRPNFAQQLSGSASQLPGANSQLPGATRQQLPGAVAGSTRPDFAQQLSGSTSQLTGANSQLSGATRQQLPGAVAGSSRPDFAQQLSGSTSQLPGANSQLPGATRQQLPGAVAGSTRPDFAQQLSGSTSQLTGANSQLPGATRQQLPAGSSRRNSAQHRPTGENPPLLVGARGGGVVLGGTAIMNRQVICVITEQPASKALRFRYECEGRSAGSIPGVSSTPENKTYPTIQIENYKGRAVVVVSCVTKDSPYKPHPHSLVGKEGCKHGVCTMEVNTETMALSFANLGIQCIKKKDIDAALNQREKLRIDPFKTGYEHKNQPGSIDLNAVRLCFQVFLEGKVKNQFNVAITPVVSEPIYDKKAMSDLVICKLSEDSAPVVGGKQIILLCEKVAKEDISVRLYEELNNQIVWEGQCDFQTTDVHKQVAITFRTPRYKNIDVTEPILVQIQLVRPSDKAASEPLPFQLTPIQSAPSIGVRRKRAKYDVVQELEATNAKLMQCDGTLVKQELEREQAGGGYWQTSPVYVGGAPSPAAAPGASPDYTNLAAIAGPSSAYGGLVYAPPPPFSPAASVASPPEHQASVSPLPQMGHPLDQMNNLSMIQQQVNLENNLNIIQPQHSPMQHNISIQQQQHSPMSNIVDNIMQQHSPLQQPNNICQQVNIVDNMAQQQQQQQQNNLCQQVNNIAQQVSNMTQQQQSSLCQQVSNMTQQQRNNLCQQVGNMAQSNMSQQHVVMDMDTQQHSIELSAGRLDSRDLRDLDLDSVSENLSANLNLNDVAGSENMTDSLGRIDSNSLMFYNGNNNNFPPPGGSSSNML